MQRQSFYPMTIGQILDATFKLYRQSFFKFIAIVAVVQVPLYLVSMYAVRIFLKRIDAGGMQHKDPFDIIAAIAIPLLLALLATLWSSAALTRGVSDSYLGRATTVGQAYKYVAPRLLTLVIFGILSAVIIGIGFLLFIIPGIIFMLWFSIGSQTIVIENVSAIEGMNRSKALVSGNLGKVFGLTFLVGILTWVLGWVVTQIAGLAVNSIGPDPKIQVTVYLLIEMVGKIIIAPIGAIPLILLYYDMRIRKEGFDLEMLARSMSSMEGGGNVPPVGRF